MGLIRIVGIILFIVGAVYLIQGAILWGLILLLVGLFVAGGVSL